MRPEGLEESAGKCTKGLCSTAAPFRGETGCGRVGGESVFLHGDDELGRKRGYRRRIERPAHRKWFAWWPNSASRCWSAFLFGSRTWLLVARTSAPFFGCGCSPFSFLRTCAAVIWYVKGESETLARQASASGEDLQGLRSTSNSSAASGSKSKGTGRRTCWSRTSSARTKRLVTKSENP